MARAKKTRNVLRYYCIPQKLAFRTKRFNYSPSCAMKTETLEKINAAILSCYARKPLV